jgi:hypothetical protein
MSAAGVKNVVTLYPGVDFCFLFHRIKVRNFRFTHQALAVSFDYSSKIRFFFPDLITAGFLCVILMKHKPGSEKLGLQPNSYLFKATILTHIRDKSVFQPRGHSKRKEAVIWSNRA